MQSSAVRPVCVDLFCCAGGASDGLAAAGFDVRGVDREPQPEYPYSFTLGDALAASLAGADFVWASPPCQHFTAYKRRPGHVAPALNLIPETRAMLRASGLPYVIENVPGAPLENPVTLCGSMFGLDVRRHRIFECSFPVQPPPVGTTCGRRDFLAPPIARRCRARRWRSGCSVSRSRRNGSPWASAGASPSASCPRWFLPRLPNGSAAKQCLTSRKADISMSKKLTPAEALKRAKATSDETGAALAEGASSYVRGTIDFAKLEELAKKHTNAVHAVGRARKHKKEGV